MRLPTAAIVVAWEVCSGLRVYVRSSSETRHPCGAAESIVTASQKKQPIVDTTRTEYQRAPWAACYLLGVYRTVFYVLRPHREAPAARRSGDAEQARTHELHGL